MEFYLWTGARDLARYQKKGKIMKSSHIHIYVYIYIVYIGGTLPVIYLSIERDRKIPHLYYTQ